jgi:hypothetical protein
MTSAPLITRAIILAGALGLLSACGDSAVSLDRKMSEIRREQCDPLPTEAQRLSCVRSVDKMEDDALHRNEQVRQEQVIQTAVDQLRSVIIPGR